MFEELHGHVGELEAMVAEFKAMVADAEQRAQQMLMPKLSAMMRHIGIYRAAGSDGPLPAAQGTAAAAAAEAMPASAPAADAAAAGSAP